MTTANTSNGNFVWYEHMAKDPTAAIGFYTEVAGWKTQPFGKQGYTMWVGSQGPLGGVMTIPAEAAKTGARPSWMAHVQVTNLEQTTALAKQLSGKICKNITAIPTVGRFAVLADPQGAPFMVFQPDAQMTAHDTTKAGEFCWNELLTPDSTAAFSFYSQLFGWKILQEMDMGAMGVYRIFGIGEKRIGGILTTTKDSQMPPMWLFYTETPDLDAAIKRAKELGATVMNGPLDVPGGGRIAQLTDPQGAPFALHQSPQR